MSSSWRRDYWQAVYAPALAAAGKPARYFNGPRPDCLAMINICLDRIHRLTGTDVEALADDLVASLAAIKRAANVQPVDVAQATGKAFSTRAAAGQRRKAGAGSVGSAAGTGLAPADVRPKSQQSRPARGKAAQ